MLQLIGLSWKCITDRRIYGPNSEGNLGAEPDILALVFLSDEQYKQITLC